MTMGLCDSYDQSPTCAGVFCLLRSISLASRLQANDNAEAIAHKLQHFSRCVRHFDTHEYILEAALAVAAEKGANRSLDDFAIFFAFFDQTVEDLCVLQQLIQHLPQSSGAAVLQLEVRLNVNAAQLKLGAVI